MSLIIFGLIFIVNNANGESINKIINVVSKNINNDNTPPIITSLSPSDGWFRDDILLEAEWHDPDGNESVNKIHFQYSLDGTTDWITITDNGPTNGFDWTSGLESRTVYLRAKAFDGETWSTNWSDPAGPISIDNTAPSISNWQTTPDNLSPDHYGLFKVEVEFNNDLLGIVPSSVKIAYRIGMLGSIDNWINMTMGSWYYNIPEPIEGWSGFEGDSVYYKVKCNDYVGNIFESQVQAKAIGNGKPSNQWGPLIQTNWFTAPPYNEILPLNPATPTYRGFFGCVPIAIAQIINYYQHIGGFQLFETDEYESGNGVSIDDDSLLYDFPSFRELNIVIDNIRRKYAAGESLTSKEAGVLMFSYGISVNTYVTYNGATGSIYIANSLLNRFDYSSAQLVVDEDFWDLLIHNLVNSMPVMLLVSNNQSHAIICDGYHTDGLFHLRFGFGGVFDGWYELPDGMPGGYDSVYGAVLNIKPEGEIPIPEKKKLTISVNGGNGGTYPDQGEYNYNKWRLIDIEATNSPYSQFSYWSGGVVDSLSAKTKVLIDKDKNIYANFEILSSNWIIGDVDEDSTLTALDAIFLFRTVTGLLPVPESVVNPNLPDNNTITGYVNQYGDYNNDGSVNALDAIDVFRFATGLPPRTSIPKPTPSDTSLLSINIYDINEETNEVTIGLKVKNAYDLCSFAFHFSFDHNNAEFIELQESERLTEKFQSDALDNNKLHVVAGNLSGETVLSAGEGYIGFVKFKINGSLGEDFDFQFDSYDNCYTTTFQSIRFQVDDSELIDFIQSTAIDKNSATDKFLLKAYPNPFNSTVNIQVEIPADGKYDISIYNISGQLLKKIKQDYLKAGNYQFYWDGKDNGMKSCGSGIYLCCISGKNKMETLRMIYIK